MLRFKSVLTIFIALLLFVSFFSLYQSNGTPWTGNEPTPTNLLLYLHNSSSGLPVGSANYLNVLTTQNDTSPQWSETGNVVTGYHYLEDSFVIFPQLAGDLRINGTIRANLYMNQSGSSLTGGSTYLNVYMMYPNGSKVLIGTSGNPNSLIPAGSKPPGTPTTLTGPTLNLIVPSGNTILIQINVSGTSSSHYGLWWGLVNHTYYQSTISLPVSTYLNIQNVRVTKGSNENVSVLPLGIKNKTANIYANITDPLGIYDFDSYPVYFSMKSSNGSLILSKEMIPVSSSPFYDFSQNYEVSFNYSSILPGEYTLIINATDNTYHNLFGTNTLPIYFGRIAQYSINISIGAPPVPVIINVRDEMNVTLSNATIDVFESGAFVYSELTNKAGNATFLLSPNQIYNITVFWENVNVGAYEINVSNVSNFFSFQVHVIYPKFQLLSINGTPLSYSLIIIEQPNGTTLPLIISNGSGMFLLSQVPSGIFMITVIYDDSPVLLSEPINVTNNNLTSVIIKDVYTIHIKVDSSTGSPLPGVFIQIRNKTNGAVIGSGITNGSGELNFVVPSGSYIITGNLKTTYYLTNVQQNISEVINVNGTTMITLVFSKAFPSFFNTVFFVIILLYAIMIIIIIIFLVLLINTKRKIKGA